MARGELVTGRRGETWAIVQARTTSSRLPGKVLRPLAGEPMVLRQLERIGRATRLDGIVVATSDDPSDDDLAILLADAGYDYVRGPLDDVLGRFIVALDEYQPDVVVRLTADCPLISPRVIDLVVERFHSSTADYVSNTMEPTYPDGLDVEVITASTLREVAAVSTDVHEREHVTLGIYRRTDRFSVENCADPAERDNSQLRWTVDNAGDFAFVSEIYQQLFPAEFEYEDVLALLVDRPDLNRTSADAPRNAALDALDTGAMHHLKHRDAR
jgi:spore coat polysaccharide biosynthesis protein SpsF